jgi:hypothetical protein
VTGGDGSGHGALTVAATALLASVAYNPATLTTQTTSVTSWGALDSTNLTISFTAPASGNVLVRLEAPSRTSANFNYMWTLLTHNTTTSIAVAALPNVATGSFIRTPATFKITGLTPGNVYQYDWGHGMNNTSSTGSTEYGGATSGAAPGGGVGAAIMEVWSA